MKKQKQFSIEEKVAFINSYSKKQDDMEFNEIELGKERIIKTILIMIECGMIIVLTLVTTFTWRLDWMSNINDWLTNIVVPMLIFNFLNSVWMLIERKKKRIKVCVRLSFYFLSMIITFLISASLRVEFYDSVPIWVVATSILCASISVSIFIRNYEINKREASKNLEYQIAIMNEIIEDINSAEEDADKEIGNKKEIKKRGKI